MTDDAFTLGDLRQRGRERLGQHAALEVDLLLASACAVGRTALTAFPERTVAHHQAATYLHWLEQRQQGTPLAYLTGERDFWTLRLTVSPAVLIPRPETEHLVEQALAHLPASPARVLDAGTGSGAVALALASERPNDRVLGLDASHEALRVASLNRQRHRIGNVSLLASDWLTAISKQPAWDVIASNPPYIAAHDEHLQRGDLRFEPRRALSDGADGLGAIRDLARQAYPRLQHGGWLLLEHGFDQASGVRHCLKTAGYHQIESWRDLAGHERITGGQR